MKIKRDIGIRLIPIILGLVSLNIQAGIIIDNFTSGNQTVTTAGSSDTVTGINALGGARKIEMLEASGSTNASVVSSAGFFLHSTDPTVTASSKITWNANTVGLNVDLTEGGLVDGFFSLDVASTDTSLVSLEISLEDNDGTVESQIVTNLAVGINLLSFSSFTDNMDFTNIKEIALTVGMQSDGVNFQELQLNITSTGGRTFPDLPGAPEPSILALIGLGLFSFNFNRRKKLV